MLLEPFSFSGLSLKNRIVRSATYEKRADEDGHVTDFLIGLYNDLARGGSGLIITGNALVHPSGRSIPRMLSIHSDIYIEGLRMLTDAVHGEGGIIAVQLVHGGRQCPLVLLGGARPLAPSEVPDTSSGITPKAMTDAEIWEVIDAFGEAAGRAQAAGFDAVELHGAHGFLISGFLSPHTNRRDDYWGGDEERRFHFVEEVSKAARKAVGKEYPVLIKMNADDLLPSGIKPEEGLRAALRLEASGIDAVEISGGMRESAVKTIRPDILKPEEEAYFRDSGRLFKGRLRIPVILTGGMRSMAVMEDALKKGEADLIGLSRPLIREPELPELMKGGKEKADCISCNGCTAFAELDHVRCTQV
ncbi:MAG: NADH:flavin oxidoreductase [Thermodesulfovibrionales bacterium]|nr:NADH:flavin oxidoreductase [Thermodesulfovibrionales bacterium]